VRGSDEVFIQERGSPRTRSYSSAALFPCRAPAYVLVTLLEQLQLFPTDSLTAGVIHGVRLGKLLPPSARTVFLL